MSKLSVIMTVTTSYGGSITAEELAALIVDPSSARDCNVYAFCFFNEVWLKQQLAFVEEMNVDLVSAILVAREFSKIAGWEMPLGALPLVQLVKERYRLDYLPVEPECVENYREFLEKSREEQDAFLGTLDELDFELYLSFQIAQMMFEPPENRAGPVTPEKVAAHPDRYRWDAE